MRIERATGVTLNLPKSRNREVLAGPCRAVERGKVYTLDFEPGVVVLPFRQRIHAWGVPILPMFRWKSDKLMDDPQLRQKMGAAGRARVERDLQWSVVGNNLLAAYKHLLA